MSSDSNFPIVIATTAPSPLPFNFPPSLENPTTPYTTTLRNLFKPQNPAAPTNAAAARNWADLPTNILFGLFKYLDPKIDIPHLRSVCPSWRSALPLPLLPDVSCYFKFPSRPKLHHIKDEQPLFLRGSDYYLFSSASDNTTIPWLVKLTKFAKTSCRISNPCNMGPYFTPIPPVIGEISLLDLKAIKLSSPLYLVSGGVNRSPFDFESGKILSQKIVGGWNLRCGFGKDYKPFCVLIMLKEKTVGGGLIFKKWGDESWRIIKNDIDDTCESLEFVDITFFEGNIYVFEESNWQIGIIQSADCENGESPFMEFVDAPDLLDDEFTGVIQGINFVPGNGGLFLVFEVSETLARRAKLKLVVYLFDEHEGEWSRVWNIGDEVFFIASDVSFAVSSELLPAPWKGGTIWFLDRKEGMPLIDSCVKASGDTMPEGVECLDDAISYFKYWMMFEVFDMNDEEEKGVVALEELENKEAYTRLFFPPPSWVKWRCPSRNGAEVQLHNLKFSDNYWSGNGAACGADLLEEVP